MARKKPTQVKTATPSPPLATWKKPWVWLAGSVGALALLLTNTNSILSNARALPNEVRMTSNQFFSWYYAYPAWKGHWTNYPEGFVDIAEMNLSQEDFRINIDETQNGFIAGTIETDGICQKLPYFDFFLIVGEIASATSAKVDIIEHVGGYRRVFAKATLRRDGHIMTVIPEEDPAGIFRRETRIARDPDELDIQDRQPLCGTKRGTFIMKALQSQKNEAK